jgi:hypothetical protein
MQRLSARGHIGPIALFERQEDASPQLAGFANSVGELDIRHASILIATHGV